jgi:ABC-type arginine transport system permease subunit
MPLLLGKLVVLTVATVVTVSIALALGTIIAAIDESDERQARDIAKGRP